MSSIQEEMDRAARIISDAGGSIVGRTRLQKIAYLLEAMNFGEGFNFEYKHYGPYSEQLSTAIRYAEMFGQIEEEVKVANWGGQYSIFKSNIASTIDPNSTRAKVIHLGRDADSVELELAATAVLLASEGCTDPWQETMTRKPEKAAQGRIDRAKALLAQFKTLDDNHQLANV